MDKNKKNDGKLCDYCRKLIFLNYDRYVLLATIHKQPVEEKYYHFNCFSEFWNKKIEQAIMKRINAGFKGVQKAVELFQKEMA